MDRSRRMGGIFHQPIALSLHPQAPPMTQSIKRVPQIIKGSQSDDVALKQETHSIHHLVDRTMDHHNIPYVCMSDEDDIPTRPCSLCDSDSDADEEGEEELEENDKEEDQFLDAFLSFYTHPTIIPPFPMPRSHSGPGKKTTLPETRVHLHQASALDKLLKGHGGTVRCTMTNSSV
ncbi:hypothetical protein BJ684DRAFT_19352 [Piptocephalis cylindrospora]|uniref:Uncharacterized protein n=1 Tax=Piptocephalis cylindrospora TaxID=1907219 RepID=A0A4P9Y5H7_9FUNG|nr:hypothetical protein BJ684DRAFT_19352 [Piptocephalis cylindrospora]|eukprot:RKP14227.1 hypothetical protein BJ684DRAFT_19352 [Piptocephalis cylindrospora]